MQIMERVVGREAVAARWEELQSTARQSLQMFVCPPYSMAATDHSESLQGSLLQRGGESWVIYSQEALKSRHVLSHLRHMKSLREQSRVASRLPLKLAIVDRSMALVSGRAARAGQPVDTSFIVRESPALDGLIALFDSFWQRSAEAGCVAPVSLVKSVDEQAVLKLLAQGLKDDAIARRLGLSTHTVRRRIGSIMRQLGVTSRFQAGLVLGSHFVDPYESMKLRDATDSTDT